MKKNILISGIIVGCLCFGVLLVHADTNNPIIISQAKLTTTPTNPMYLRQLYQGMSGDDVNMLQTLLASWPGIYPEKLVTGYYGVLTAQAVVRFQIAHKLLATGSVDATTLRAINGLSATIPSPEMSDIGSVSISSDATRVSWKTNVPATTRVFYSASKLYTMGATMTVQDTHLTTSHVVDLTHLLPGTTYNFELITANNAGIETHSGVRTFVTAVK